VEESRALLARLRDSTRLLSCTVKRLIEMLTRMVAQTTPKILPGTAYVRFAVHLSI
jgi:hypothetical protein